MKELRQARNQKLTENKNYNIKVHGDDRPFNSALTTTRQVWATLVMEEKKKRRHLSGPSEGREEEAVEPNPHTSFDCNQASIILAALERERMVPTMGNLSAVTPKI